jgi:hypothetical protein
VTSNNVPYSGVLAAFTTSNLSQTPQDFAANVSWGDGQSTTGTISAVGNGLFKVSGTHIYAATGVFTISVNVNSVGGGAISLSNSSAGPAPLLAAGIVVQPTEGTTFQGTVAPFTFGDTTATVQNFSASIDWGDGHSSTGSIVADSPGAFDVQGTHTYADEVTTNPFKVTIAITGVGGSVGAVGNAVSSATVQDAPLTPTITAIQSIAGATFQGAVASFTDAAAGPASDFTATIEWGDGQTSSGTIVPNASGGFGVQGAHAYAREGHFTVAVTVHDVGGVTASAQSSAAVSDAPLTATGLAVQPTAGAAFQGTLATFTDADATATPADFTASIDWGDSQSSTGSIVAASGGFAIQGSHTYASEGVDAITVHLSDAGGSSATATSTAHVARAGPPPSQLTPVAAAFTQSDEYYGNLITAAYQRYLGRNPEAAGLAYWIDQYDHHGLTDEHLEAGFIGSAEYIANHGGTGDTWVVGMYRDLLGRDPDAAGLAYWQSKLHQGANPDDIAYGFAASAEREGQHVTADYQHYLGRTPAPSEVDYWVGQFVSAGWTNERVIAGFVGSAEYFKNHADNAVDWLQAAYQAILNRPPDTQGQQQWLPILEQS